jgi:DNA-binding NarL/FixJ family response regulator
MGGTSRLDLMSFLDALYQVEQPQEAWFAAVLAAVVETLRPSAGVGGVIYDLTQTDTQQAFQLRGHSVSPEWLQVGRKQHDDPRLTASLHEGYTTALCVSSEELAAKVRAQGPDVQIIEPDMTHHGVTEMVMINGGSPGGRGCACILFWDRGIHLTAKLRADFTRVAVHLATARRLNTRLTAHAAPADAVLRTDGKLEHAEVAAQSREAQDELRVAAEAMAWARSRAGREQPTKALEQWRGLVSGQWSLVDRLERDGKRYVLARQNSPITAADVGLSAREQQVLALAHLGRSNKVIAYELGIAHATVRVLVARRQEAWRLVARRVVEASCRVA